MQTESQLRVVRGDAVAALKRGEINVLAHQVNLQGAMGAGIAKQIREAFPNVYTAYREALAERGLILGSVQLVRVGAGLWIANISGQSKFGRGGNHTDYGALRMAFSDLAELIDGTALRVGLPYGIGCGLAGGDWSIVSAIIAEHLPQAVLYRL